jgi:hypothetical protein
MTYDEIVAKFVQVNGGQPLNGNTMRISFDEDNVELFHLSDGSFPLYHVDGWLCEPNGKKVGFVAGDH